MDEDNNQNNDFGDTSDNNTDINSGYEQQPQVNNLNSSEVEQPNLTEKKKGIQLSKKQGILVVLLLVILIGASVAAYFLLLPKETDNQQLTQKSETEEPEETEEEPSENIYESKVFGISFEVPEGWEVTENSKNVIVKSPNYVASKTFAESDTPQPEKGSVIVLYSYDNEGKSLDELIQENPGARDYDKEQSGSGVGPESYPLKDIRALEVSGIDAKQYVWAFEGSHLTTELVDDSKVYVVNIDIAQGSNDEELSDYDEFRVEYDQILDSLQIL